MEQERIVLNVTYTAKPGQGPAFAQALAQDGVLGRVRQEAGCLQYELFSAVETPDRLLLVEGWASQGEMDAHCAGENFKTMQAIEGRYVDGVDVKRF